MESRMKTWVLCGLFLSWAGSAQCRGFALVKGPKVQGRFGYSVEFPKGYAVAKNEGSDGSDTVAAWPLKNKVKFSDILDIKKAEALGIISLRVYPRAHHAVNMADHAEKIKRSAEAKGMANVWSMQKFPAGEGMAVSIMGEDANSTILLIEGKNNLFELRAGELSDALVATTRSVREGAKAAPGNSKKEKQNTR